MATLNELSSVRNIPRNRFGGTLADILQAIKSNTGVVGDFMLGQAPEVVNNMSYGFNPTRGQGMTYGMKPEAADLANIMPAATIGGLLGKSYAKLAGKELARQVQGRTGMVGRNVMNPRMNMVAYHGSPHSFDKFDSSKIGTGEGAQAYGNGLYFAESKDVAKGYANELGSKFSVNGKSIYNANKTHGSVDNSDLQDALIASLGNAKQASKSLLTSAAEMRKANVSPKDYQLALAELRKIRGGIKLENTGNLYKVDIPDAIIPKMLDWDKPLSQQSAEVLNALEKKFSLPSFNADFANAGDFYKSRVKKFDSDVKASNEFRDLGITGIRYLDGSSRSAGQGSSNFVVFDDKLPKILERNGKQMRAK